MLMAPAAAPPSPPDESPPPSTCGCGIASSATPAGRMVIVLIFGPMLRGRYETVTSRRRGATVPRLSVARHCRYREGWLLIASPSVPVTAADQSLQVESGVDVLPLRVCNSIAPSPTHEIRPQVAVVPESRTDEVYVPLAAVSLATLNNLPKFDDATNN